MVNRAKFIKWTDAQIAKCYEKTHSCSAVSKKLGIGKTTIYRALERSGVERDGLKIYRAKASAFSPEQDLAIKRRYERGELSADLAAEFGVTIHSIKSSLRRCGGAIRPDPSPRATPDEEEQVVELYEDGLSQMKISLQIGRSQSFVTRVLRSRGIRDVRRTREAHSQWKGGRNKAEGGYIRILVAETDAMAVMRDSNGYVLEHRLAMARKLGRPLLKTETVHHKDGDRENNDADNLQLRIGRHGKHMAMCCLDCGSQRIGYAAIED